MINTPLLSSKLFVPSANPRHIRRVRLTEKLLVGLRTRLMVVSAPAGFGKTTLISGWLHEMAENENSMPVCFCWLSLDEGDNDVSRFVAYLGAAFETLSYCAESELSVTKDLSQLTGVEEKVNLLINQMTGFEHTMILVLDDYHLIESPEVHHAMNTLIDYLPPSMHLVLLTRSEPPLRLARLRACGELVEIGQKDLRFTQEEAQLFFNRTRDLSLTQEQVAKLTERTEGWIAGLQMAALAILSNVEPDQSVVIRELSGSSRFIFDYLMDEVLLRQPAAVQSFLFKTSILTRLNAALCDAVLDEERTIDSAQMLQSMETHNVFIIALDAQRHWYRYHHLFADLLRRKLETSQPQNLALLHRRASRWYENNGMMAEAIEHALAAARHASGEPGEYRHALDLIEGQVETALAAGETGTVSRWLDELPDELMRLHPYLCVYHSFTQMLCGGSQKAIEERLNDARAYPDDVVLQKLVAVFQSLLTLFRGNDSSELFLAEDILAGIPENKRFLRSMIITLQAISEIFNFDLADSTKNLEDASRFSREAGNWMAYALLHTQIGDINTFQGKLHAARTEYDHVIEVVRDNLGSHSPVAGMAFIGKGAVLCEWNNLVEAQQMLNLGFKLVQAWGDANAMDYHIHMTRVQQALGNTTEALHQMSLASQLAVKFDLSDLDDRYIDALKASLLLKQGDIEAARYWISEDIIRNEVPALLEKLNRFRGNDIDLLVFEMELLSAIRFSLATNRFDNAYELTDALFQKLDQQSINKYSLEGACLYALICQKTGDLPAAVPILEKTLLRAEEEGFVRIFLEEGPAMAQLLSEAAVLMKNPRAKAYTAWLLKAFEQPVKYFFVPDRRDSDPAAGSSAAPVNLAYGQVLSIRECEVLSFIADGLSNQQIAERMVIALSTVKSHIHSIYQKLGVTNRTSAVARSRDLNLV